MSDVETRQDTAAGAGRTADPGEPAEVTRALSPLERWYWIADQVSPLNVIARVRVRGRLPVSVLRRALDALQARHPLLRVAIATDADGANARFVPTRALIPLREASAGDPGRGEDWVRETNERELVERIDWAQGPLCRTTVLTTAAGDTHDLILTLAHCIADGTTVLSLLKDWIGLAAEPHTWSAEPALPPCEEMFPPRQRGTAGAIRLRLQMLRDRLQVRRHHPRRAEPDRFVAFEQRRTRLLHRCLSADQVDALTRACRREKTTVHGALAAAMVTAIARETGGSVPTHVAIGSPIDLRDALTPPVPDHAVGTYVATVPSFVAYRPGGSPWAVARALTRDLGRRRRRGEPFGMVRLIGGSCPATVAASGPLIEYIESRGPVNLCISNVGRFDFPSVIGEWQVSGAQFVAGLSVVGYFVSTVNTSHGQLFWNFTFVEDALPVPRAERLVTDCVDTVLALLDPYRPSHP